MKKIDKLPTTKLEMNALADRNGIDRTDESNEIAFVCGIMLVKLNELIDAVNELRLNRSELRNT